MTNTPDIAADGAAENESKPARSIGAGALLDLYSRPRRFFGGELDIEQTSRLLPAILIVGIAGFIDRVDSRLIQATMWPERPSSQIVLELAGSTWAIFWLVGLIGGALSAVLQYFVGGWWYRMRLRMAGSGPVDDKAIPRAIYMWSSAIFALPLVMLTLAYTAVYPNYLGGFNSEGLFALFLPIMLFWSVGVSYTAATTVFTLTTWKAQLWFLYLPAAFYLTLIGGVFALLEFFR